MRRAYFLLALLGACIVAIALRVTTPSGHGARPNVLIVTIDTLRPDAIGEGTPAIGAFLESATTFDHARTVAPLTLVAHVSMFTGLMPQRHAIHDNVTEPLPPRGARGFPLLAEEMRDAGYATAGFAASAALAPATGIAGGFEVYDCPTAGEGAGGDGYVVGEERVRAAIEWMRGAPGGRPWLVWVHLYDPHAPYRPFPGDAARPASHDGDAPAALYAGEVRRADAAFERLVEAAGPDTVVVLASDHGEGLGEHGEVEHGPLCYGSTIDVLLAVRAPGFRAGVRDTELRSVADLAPTVRNLCGLEARDADGRDLRGAGHATLVAESLISWRMHNWGQALAVTDGRFTLVESGARLELFDRISDPHETFPRPLTLPAYETLDRALEAFRSTGSAPAHEGEMYASVPPYGLVRRDVSGYLSRHENARLPDPRALLDPWMSMEAVPVIVRMALDRKDPAPLNEAFRRITRMEHAEPRSPRIPHYRAAVFAALAEITGERAWYAQAAWAQFDAIDKGYTSAGSIRLLLQYAAAGEDRDVLCALKALVRRTGQRLDPDIRGEIESAVPGKDEAVFPALGSRR